MKAQFNDETHRNAWVEVRFIQTDTQLHIRFTYNFVGNLMSSFTQLISHNFVTMTYYKYNLFLGNLGVN